MASPSPRNLRNQRFERRDLDTNDEDDDEIRRNSDSEEEDDQNKSHIRNTSHRSNESFGQNNSAIRGNSPQFSDGSFSSPNYRNRRRGHSGNTSQSSKSPCTPQKLYPELDDPTPKSGRRETLYPDLPGSKVSSFIDSPNKTKELSSSILKEAESTCTNMSAILIIAFILFGLIISIMFVFRDDNPDTGTSTDGLMPFEKFVKGIEHLQTDFPTQGRRTWKTVKATAKHVLNETDPIYPSIILIGSETGNSKLSTCIAKKIAGRFKSSAGDRSAEHTTDIENYSHLSSAEQKMRLDQAFEQAFHKGGSKSILVENLQSLSGEAALLLYKYCDNDNAPYRNVLILLTINVWPGETDLTQSANVEGYLARIWKKSINADKVNALMSRVANNIVVVNKESQEVFKQKC